MSESSHSKSKWTIEICRQEALKYSYRASFQKNSPAYKAAYKYGWLDEICGHMVKPYPHNYKWTFEECEKEAKKYSLKKDFQSNSNIAFQIASKKKWLEQICSHMTEVKKPHKYYTKERCAEEALKYKHRNDFSINSNSAYCSAQKNNWLDEICNHMTFQGSEMHRYVYSFTFSDGSIYFGLTSDYKRRIIEHKKDSTSKVFKHIKLTNEEPEFKLITPYLVPTETAQQIEKDLIKEYLEKGIKILNVDKGGGIGGSKLIWTKDKCKNEAFKYTTRGDFREKSQTAYVTSHKKGWLNEICAHMFQPIKPHGFWTKERCIDEANKHNTKADFRNHSSAAFSKAEKNKWLNEICGHMVEIKKPNNFWNLEMCLDEAKQYSRYIEFQKKSSSAYSAALKNSWLKPIQENFKEIKKPNGYWTYELCELEARKYKNKNQFRNGSSAAHDASCRNKWLDLFYPKKNRTTAT